MSRRWLIVLLAAAGSVGACAGDPVPTPAAPGGMVDIRLIAQGIAFQPTDVGTTAGTPFRLVIHNRDPGVPHTGAIGDADLTLAETEIVEGPAEAAIEVPGLPPGRYPLTCLIHPNMVATLHVD